MNFIAAYALSAGCDVSIGSDSSKSYGDCFLNTVYAELSGRHRVASDKIRCELNTIAAYYDSLPIISRKYNVEKILTYRFWRGSGVLNVMATAISDPFFQPLPARYLD